MLSDLFFSGRLKEGLGVVRSSIPPPWKSREHLCRPLGWGICSGKLCVYVRQEEALQARVNACSAPEGAARVCLHVHMEAWYMSHEERAVLTHTPPFCLQRTNKQQHGTQRAALPRQTTDISEGSVFFMNNEISTQNTSTPLHTHTHPNSVYCTPHKKPVKVSREGKSYPRMFILLTNVKRRKANSQYEVDRYVENTKKLHKIEKCI